MLSELNVHHCFAILVTGYGLDFSLRFSEKKYTEYLAQYHVEIQNIYNE